MCLLLIYLFLGSFPPIGSLYSALNLLPCLIESGSVMFGCCLLEACSFLRRNGEGVDLGLRGGERGVERRET